MQYIKIGGITAGTAFLLSFFIGLIGRASFPDILTRAFIFGGVFFGLFQATAIVTKRFLPDLTEGGNTGREETENAPAGSQVDISVEDENNAGGSEGETRTQDEFRGSLDQNAENRYTEKKEKAEEKASPIKTFTPLSPVSDLISTEGDDGKVPDIESMAGAFIEDEEEEESEFETSSRKNSRKADKKASQFLDQFIDPAKMAGAVQTILKRE